MGHSVLASNDHGRSWATQSGSGTPLFTINAAVQTPLNVTLTLPPPAYARKGGEIIAAELAKVGVVAKIENVEWAQWLSGAFKGNFDLTVISHVEPLDFDRYADPNYYYGYDSKAYKDLLNTYNTTTDAKARLKVLGDIQRLLCGHWAPLAVADRGNSLCPFQQPWKAVERRRPGSDSLP